MLVLSRREGESVCVGGGIVVTVVRICGNKVRIGVAADKESILRAELREDAAASEPRAALTFDVPLDEAPKKKSKKERAAA